MADTYTPELPWHASSTHHGDDYDVGGADAANVCLVYGPKKGGGNPRLTAALIVRAVNHHEELVTALRVAWNALDSAEAEIEPGAPPEEIDHYILHPIAYASAISHVRVALAMVDAGDV